MDLSIFETIRTSGVMIYPLMLCSVLALAAIVERWMSLRYDKIINLELLVEVEDLLKAGKLGEALELVNKDKTPMGQVARVAILHADRSFIEIKSAIEDEGRMQLPGLQKNLALLNTLAVTSPLIGMTGTILGMIQVFGAVLGEYGLDMDVLAGGISQALVTSAIGLIIAMPCLIFYNFYFRRIETLTNELEKHSLTLYNLLKRFGLKDKEDAV